jgi:thiol-disulfide isomerase/thioredoxin
MAVLNTPLPSFHGVAHWRNGPAPTEAELAGKPVLVHFFSSGCPLCGKGMPTVRQLHATYAPAGLVVVGAFQLRQDVAATLADAERECDRHVGSGHPCAVDIEGILAARFGNLWPPAYYVYDRSHRLRHYQMGNSNLESLDAIIQRCM